MYQTNKQFFFLQAYPNILCTRSGEDWIIYRKEKQGQQEKTEGEKRELTDPYWIFWDVFVLLIKKLLIYQKSNQIFGISLKIT